MGRHCSYRPLRILPTQDVTKEVSTVSKRLMSSKAVRTEFGGISAMTVWRWLQDESLGFPKPTIIRNRNYWNADEIEAFRDRMARAAITKRAA